MYTHCPKCHHSLQISRKQLKKKQGQLTCSQCKQQFNAYLTLSKKAPQVQSKETLAPETKKIQTLVPETQIPTIPAFKKAHNQTTEEAEATNEPVIEIYDWQKPKATYHPERWMIATILGLFLLVYQVYYFQGYLLSQNSQIRPWLSSLSSYTQIPLADYRKPLEFTTVGSSLEASDKDDYRLQVSLINHADFSQPPPYLQLTLQNFYGGVFSQRIFSPQEYLNKTTTAETIERSATFNIDFLIAKPEQEIGGYSIELK